MPPKIPSSLDEAIKTTYAGPWHIRYNPDRCACPVYDCGAGRYLQCQNPNGYGVDGIFCKGHKEPKS